MKSRDVFNIRRLHKKGVFLDKSGKPTIKAVLKVKDNYKFLTDHFNCEDPEKAILEWRAGQVIAAISNDNGERIYYQDHGTNEFVEFEEIFGDREAYAKQQFIKMVRKAMQYSPTGEVTEHLLKAIKSAKAQ